jgi:hypothetical protein
MDELRPENISPEIKEYLKFKARVALARLAIKNNDVLLWGKACFPDKFTLPFCKGLHGYFVEIADETITSTVAPRGHAKTTIKCFLLPIYKALNTPADYNFYLNIQATSTKATAVNISIKNEIEQNPVLRELYGDQKGAEKWTEDLFVLKNGVVFGSVGAGESLRGMNWRNKRPDYVIIDDLYDEDDYNNKKAILKLNRWFWSSVYKAVSSSKKASIHVQGTAFAKYDLMHEMATKSTIKYKKFKSYDEITLIPLWIELNTYEKLMIDKENMGSIAFTREMQNEIKSDEISIIKIDDVQYYDVIPDNHRIIKKIIGCDPSIGEKAQSDFTGCAVCYVAVNELGVNYWYFEQLVELHLSMSQRIELLKQLYETHKADIIKIEAVAGFKDFYLETVRLTNLPVKQETKVIDKLTALEHEQSKFEGKKVFFKRGIVNVDTAVDQLTTNKPEHDDVRDAIVQCLKEDVTNPSFEVL